MARPRMDLPAFVGELLQEQDGNLLREGVRVLAQALVEAEVNRFGLPSSIDRSVTCRAHAPLQHG